MQSTDGYPIREWKDLNAIGQAIRSGAEIGVTEGVMTLHLVAGEPQQRKVYKLPHTDEDLRAINEIAEKSLKENSRLWNRVKSAGIMTLGKAFVWLRGHLSFLRVTRVGTTILRALDESAKILRERATILREASSNIRCAADFIHSVKEGQASLLNIEKIESKIIHLIDSGEYVDTLLGKPCVYIQGDVQVELGRQMKENIHSKANVEREGAIYQFERDIGKGGGSFHGMVTVGSSQVEEVNPALTPKIRDSSERVAIGLQSISELTKCETDEEARAFWNKVLQAAVTQHGSIVANKGLLTASTMLNADDSTFPLSLSPSSSLYEAELHVFFNSDGTHIERVDVTTTTPLDLTHKDRERNKTLVVLPAAVKTKISYSLTLDEQGDPRVYGVKREILRQEQKGKNEVVDIASWLDLYAIGEAIEKNQMTIDVEQSKICITGGSLEGYAFPLPRDNEEMQRWEEMAASFAPPLVEKQLSSPVPSLEGMTESDAESGSSPLVKKVQPYFLKDISEQLQRQRVESALTKIRNVFLQQAPEKEAAK